MAKKSNELDSIDKMRTEAIERVCVGIVAEQMGYANQTHVCNAGKAIFKYIGRLTYKEFRNIKKLQSSNG